MARAGISKFNVGQARDAILARGARPTIDMVRIELGNTGSKTTIQRYLKELADEEGARLDDESLLSDTLRDMVGRLARQLRGEAEQLIEDTRARHEDALKAAEGEKSRLSQALSDAQNGIEDLTAQLEAANADHKAIAAALTEANAQIREKDQAISDLHARLADKDERIASLEDKHRHARESLTHYRQSVKEQRDQDLRQHDEQIRQLQTEVRQQAQTLVAKQNEVSQLSQDAARLATEQRECQRQQREQASALSDAQRRLATLEDERQQWDVSTARMEERLAAAESTRIQAEKLAEQSAVALLESRGTAEELRIRVSRQQEQIEEMQQLRKKEARGTPGEGPSNAN